MLQFVELITRWEGNEKITKMDAKNNHDDHSSELNFGKVKIKRAKLHISWMKII